MSRHRVLIVGGGFGGLFCAKQLGDSDFDVTLIDRRNFHLFQPLLYQVATGSLSVDDIATPQRAVLQRAKNVRTLMAGAYDLDVDARRVYHEHGVIDYDSLVVCTGVKHHYFGNDGWRVHAPGLKTIEHALEMRYRLFRAFERAEQEPDPEKRAEWMTFVVVGAGPTGVELAGAIAELANRTLVKDFRAINPADCRILLVENLDTVLPPFEASLREYSRRALESLNVQVMTSMRVKDVAEDHVTVEDPNGHDQVIRTRTTLWAAGVKITGFGSIVAERTAAQTARGGRIKVGADLSVPGHPEIFVIGDMAAVTDGSGQEVPGVAPAAMQMGQYVARQLIARARGADAGPFVFDNHGQMAVIGRSRAVGELRWGKVRGALAWWLWVLVHIWSLIGFEQRIGVMTRWGWKYLTQRAGARLITGGPPDTSLLQRERRLASRYGSGRPTPPPPAPSEPPTHEDIEPPRVAQGQS